MPLTSTVTKYIEKGKNVLVQEAEGNDNVPQLCSLVQLLIDPYFRTLEGNSPMLSLNF